jgi:hypothetical protein
MKKILLIALALVLVLGTMAGCGKKDDTPSGGTSTPTTSTSGTSSTTTPGGTTSTTTPGEGERLVSKVGDSVEYGTFNGKAITWQVLAVDISDTEHQKALLIPTEIVAYWVWGGERKDVTWEDSTIRQWLNGDFYNAVFTDDQKAIILESDIENKANSESGVGGGANTTDRVFLLSLDEVTKYLPSETVRSVKYNATQAEIEGLAKAISEAGASENWSSKSTYDNALADLKSYNGTTDRWWLRTSGRELARAAAIAYDGSLDITGDQVFQLEGVRPAVWVDITPKTESSSVQ